MEHQVPFEMLLILLTTGNADGLEFEIEQGVRDGPLRASWVGNFALQSSSFSITVYVLITNRYEFIGFAAAMKSLGLMEKGDYFLVCADGESRDFGKILTGEFTFHA